MSEEIKKCPMCGGEADIFDDAYDEKRGDFYIMCCSCDLKTKNHFIETDAIKEWNKRTHDDLDKLEQFCKERLINLETITNNTIHNYSNGIIYGELVALKDVIHEIERIREKK